MNRKAIFIVAILAAIFLSYLVSDIPLNMTNTPGAVNGALDLNSWQHESELLKLDGQWEFYWNKLLTPAKIGSIMSDSTRYIDVPSSWNKYEMDGSQLASEGFATYRLVFNTTGTERLGLKLPRMFTAYKLWLNGELRTESGVVGDSRSTMTPQYLPQVILFESNNGENELVIQVSNYYHRSGGILESIILGSEDKILDIRYKSIAYDYLLFGSLVIMGLYHIFQFYFRTKDLSPLFFGLFCMLVGFRTLLVGERMLIYMFPSFNWEAAHKLQTLTFYLGVPTILAFFNTVFPEGFSQKKLRLIYAIGGAFCLFVLITPARIFTLINPAYQVFAVLVIAYVIFAFIKAFINNEKDIWLIIAGGMSLILTSINDIIYASIIMNDGYIPFIRNIVITGNLSSMGQLVFVFTNSLVLAKRFSASLEQEEVITLQLKEINQNLDQLVKKRTQALEEAGKALEIMSLKDPLTGLWNRRHYDNVIKTEWGRSQRHKSPITFMIFDIDKFKEFNDRYGHMAGDECLIKIAKTLKALFRRSSDLVFRYGGEEFLIVLSGTGLDESRIMAERALKAIVQLEIPHESSSVHSVVTVSAGVACVIPDSSNTVDQLFVAADKALYQAKDAGRNRYVMFSA